MKAICYMKPGLEICDLPEQEVGPEDIKVKIAYASICGSDPHILRGEFDWMIDAPYVMGHESSGTVTEVGPKATAKGFKVGDRVALYYNYYCGKCHYCRTGQEHFCTNVNPHIDGMAEYAVVDEQQAFKLPDSVPLDKAALTEPISVCLRGIDLANIKPGLSVAVFGAGGIGLIIEQLAALAGAVPLTVIEPVESKRKLAQELGADFVIDPTTQDTLAEAMRITEGRGFDSVLEASGNQKAAAQAFEVLGRGGTLVYFSLYGPDFKYPLDLLQLFFKEATVRGVFQSPYLFPRSVALLPKLNLQPLLAVKYPMAQAVEAYEAQKSGEHVKIMLEF